MNGDRHPPSSEDALLSEEEGVRKKPRTEAALVATSTSDNMTSKDYYFDSYSHFGELHTVVCLQMHCVHVCTCMYRIAGSIGGN